MIKNSKILLLIIIIFLGGCGYQPLYTNKDANFIIQKINYSGDEDLNYILKKKFLKLKSKNYNKTYNLNISTNYSKNLSAKDTAGNPSRYIIELKVDLEVYEKEKIILKREFNKSSNYSKLENNFDMQRYEKIMLENFLNNIYEKILMTLNSI